MQPKHTTVGAIRVGPDHLLVVQHRAPGWVSLAVMKVARSGRHFHTRSVFFSADLVPELVRLLQSAAAEVEDQ